MKPAFAADATRRRSEHDPGTHAEAFRSGVQRMGSATATSVIWVGHESPSLEFGAERPGRRHDHCRAPNRWAPCSTGMPLPSVEPATPPTDCGSPQTTAVAAVHGPQQERQTAARRSGLEPHTETAAVASAWLRRNVRQLCDGGPRRPIMYFETVDSATSNPSFSSSPWIRGAPHNGFSLLIRRMRLRSSCSILGLPGRPWDFRRQ